MRRDWHGNLHHHMHNRANGNLLYGSGNKWWTQTWALWRSTGMWWGGRREGGLYGWFTLMFGKSQHNSVKQLSFNNTFKKCMCNIARLTEVPLVVFFPFSSDTFLFLNYNISYLSPDSQLIMLFISVRKWKQPAEDFFIFSSPHPSATNILVFAYKRWTVISSPRSGIY